MTHSGQERPRTEGWSRTRGLVAAGVAIAVVALTLVVSRLDLANELSVVRSQLAAANAETADDQREIDELEDANRNQAEDLAACRELAEVSERLQDAVALLQEALERGDQGRLTRGVSMFTDARDQWLRATQACAEATRGQGQG